MNADRPLLLRPDEVALLLGISRSKVYHLVRVGRLPSTRIATSIRIPRAELEAFIERNTFHPEDI